MSIYLIPSEPLARSGVRVLAERWARSLRQSGWAVDLGRAPVLGHVGAAVRRALSWTAENGVTALVLGLPADKADAQSVVDAVAATSGRAVLLWERTGHGPAQSADGLTRLSDIAECWVLNPLFRGQVEMLMPRAQVSTAALAIPDVFFDQTEAARQRHKGYAAYLGRFSGSKRAHSLAKYWVDEVWPVTGLPLVLAGRGMGDRTCEQAIARLEQDHPGLRTLRLMSEAARARFLGQATMVAFPAIDDYLPQALAETVAAGTAVVATDIHGHRPLAPPRLVSTVLCPDLSNLSEAVVDVLGRPEAARQRALLGQRLLREEHSMAATGARLSQLLRERAA